MSKLPEDGVNTEDILLEFFPDEQRSSEAAEARTAGDVLAETEGSAAAPPVESPAPGQDAAQATSHAQFGGWHVVADANNAATVPAEPPPDRQEPEPDGATSRLLRPLLLLLAFVAFGVVSFLVGRGFSTDDSGQETATEDRVASEVGTAAEDTDAEAAAADAEAPAADAETADADAEATGSAEPADDTSTGTDGEAGSDGASAEEEASPPAASERPFVEVTPNATAWPGYPEDPEESPATGPYIIIKNGDFFLRGKLSSEELRQEMAWFTLEVVPEENVVVEYQVDPNDPFVLGDVIPVFFADVVLFDVSSERVNEDDIRDLALLGVQFLLANPTAEYTLIGHTDSTGSEDVNQALSRRRAEAVRDFYISLGAPPDQVIAVGMGESDPVADNATEAGRAQNRRVEFKFTNSG